MRRLCPRHVARLLSVTLVSCVLASPLTGAAATLANADEQPTAEPQAAGTSASKRPERATSTSIPCAWTG